MDPQSSNSDSESEKPLFEQYLEIKETKEKGQIIERSDSNINEIDISPQKTPVASSFNIDDATPKRANPLVENKPLEEGEPGEILIDEVNNYDPKINEGREPGEITPVKITGEGEIGYRQEREEKKEMLKFGDGDVEMKEGEDGDKVNQIIINDLDQSPEQLDLTKQISKGKGLRVLRVLRCGNF